MLMKRLFPLLLSFLSLAAFAEDTKSPLSAWFMRPAAHTYVGICEPNGDVQEAINVALLHYLICHDFSGKKRKKVVANTVVKKTK